ncbi:DUF6266 family protein [Pedobacter frigoris]|uniref:DUF6266 family protein n=1 Tax=Pedobacter frigoris TaxID=2571272 RepID=UPI00293009F6|nr:DUF6266 family protein [Pedobacter frigoris]
MGKLTGGPYYDLIGRTGNNVGRRVKGKNVFSMRPAKSNRPPSVLQLAQRNKFGYLVDWLAELNQFIKIGFKDYDSEMSPMNACVKVNSKLGVVTGTYPLLTLDYQKVVLSQGLLDGAYHPELASVAGGNVSFTWTLKTGSTNGEPTDKATIILYGKNTGLYEMLIGVVDRSALEYELELSEDFLGDVVQGFIAFVSADGKLVSDSAWAGSVTVV